MQKPLKCYGSQNFTQINPYLIYIHIWSIKTLETGFNALENMVPAKATVIWSIFHFGTHFCGNNEITSSLTVSKKKRKSNAIYIYKEKREINKCFYELKVVIYKSTPSSKTPHGAFNEQGRN